MLSALQGLATPTMRSAAAVRARRGAAHGARLFVAGLALAPLAACSSGEKSISLVFPNEEVRQAVVRIVVEAYSPDTGAASATDRDCGDFEGKARLNKAGSGNPVRGDYEYPFKSDQELVKVPSGRQILYVLAYASREDGAPAILEGCNDKFDSTGGADEHVLVPVRLAPVLPESSRLVKVGGDRQVGREGQRLPVTLSVRVDAEMPMSNFGTYSIPGIEVEFRSQDPDFALVGAVGGVLDGVTGKDGVASADVMLPNVVKTGEIVVEAIDVDPSGLRHVKGTQTFSLSVTELPTFPSSAVINGSDRPIGVALGRLTGTSELDLAVLSCAGSEAGCAPGGAARGELGRTKLSVYDAVGRGATPVRVVEPAGGLGVLPAGLVVADLVGGASPSGRDEIAFVNSRRADCQARTCVAGQECACWGAAPGTPCPCEGSEVLVMASDGANVVLDSRMTLTASNAISMAAYTSRGGAHKNLAIAAQGRSHNDRPCRRNSRCLQYDGPDCATHPEECGCPPMERCECTNCASSSDPGRCVARDKMVDVLVNRWDTTANPVVCSPSAPGGSCMDPNEVCQAGTCVPRTMLNQFGCQEPVLSCKNDGVAGTCECLDDWRGGSCTDHDACYCSVPERSYIGQLDAPLLPSNIAAGALRNGTDWDLVAATDSGLGLMQFRTSGAAFRFDSQPIINARVLASQVASLDSEVDQDADIVWIARGACTAGVSYERSCPIFRAEDPAAPALGCVGVYYTDSEGSVFGVRVPTRGGCRRYHLPFAPDAFCTGKFNGDDTIDVAVTSKDVDYVAVMSGDGRGGLLDPPEHIALPSGASGGPITCGDVDGDGRDDIVVADQKTGAVYVLRTGS